jgi:hypothetical protein
MTSSASSRYERLLPFCFAVDVVSAAGGRHNVIYLFPCVLFFLPPRAQEGRLSAREASLVLGAVPLGLAWFAGRATTSKFSFGG